MIEYLENQEPNGCIVGVRFFVVFLLAIFGLLAIGTEIMDVLDAYFGIAVQPLEALMWVAIGYFGIFAFFIFASAIPYFTNLPQGGNLGWIIIVLLSASIFPSCLLAYMVFDLFHPLSMQYAPGELEIRRVLLMGLTTIVVLSEAFSIAYLDLRRQMHKHPQFLASEEE